MLSISVRGAVQVGDALTFVMYEVTTDNSQLLALLDSAAGMPREPFLCHLSHQGFLLEEL